MEKYNNLYRIPSSRAHWWDYRNEGAYFITINTKNKTDYFGKIQNGIMCLNEIGTIAYNEWLKSPIIRPDMNITLGARIVMPDHIHGVIIIGRNRYNDGVMDIDGDLGKDGLQSVSTPGTPSSPKTHTNHNATGLDKNLDHGKDGLQSVSTPGAPTIPDIHATNNHNETDLGKNLHLGKDGLQSVSTSNAPPTLETHTNLNETDLAKNLDLGKDGLQSVSTPNVPPNPPHRPTPKNTFGPQRKNLSSIIRGFKTSVTIKARKINPNFGWQERYYDRILRNQKGLDNVNRYIEDNPMQWTNDRKGR